MLTTRWGMGVAFAALASLCFGSGGCSHVVRADVAGLAPPAADVARFNGTYADAGGGLWIALTESPRTILGKPGPGGDVRTRIEDAGDDGFTLIQFVDGVETERARVPCRFDDGYYLTGSRTAVGHGDGLTWLIGSRSAGLAIGSGGDLIVDEARDVRIFYLLIPFEWLDFRFHGAAKRSPVRYALVE